MSESKEKNKEKDITKHHKDSLKHFAERGPNIDAAETIIYEKLYLLKNLVMMLELYEASQGRRPPPSRVSLAEEISGNSHGNISAENIKDNTVPPYKRRNTEKDKPLRVTNKRKKREREKDKEREL